PGGGDGVIAGSLRAGSAAAAAAAAAGAAAGLTHGDAAAARDNEEKTSQCRNMHRQNGSTGGHSPIAPHQQESKVLFCCASVCNSATTPHGAVPPPSPSGHFRIGATTAVPAHALRRLP